MENTQVHDSGRSLLPSGSCPPFFVGSTWAGSRSRWPA